ncbi:MAG: ATP-grasp domain-containing protein [Methanobacteriaceae archaeon]|jgi:predicted ATP-grasp superfamily ATP-dependent carboligase|nr:ATP-grasp domain-containing protein [Candidatus Methanorudis spinitermitis]
MNKTDFKEENSILVFEYYTASGIDDPKIISEAVAMINSLLDDLKDFNVYFLLSKKFDFIAKNHEHLKSIIIEENLQKWLSNNVCNFNSCMFISSEENMLLYEITNLIEKNNVKLYCSNTFATLLCSDKFKTYRHIKDIIKQPKTLKFTIDEKFQWEIAIPNIINFFNIGNSKLSYDIFNEKFKLIAKPVYGVDCQDTKIISNIRDIRNLKKIFPIGSSFLIQEFIEGDVISVSLISDGEIAIPISLNKQNIALNHDNFTYLGGELPYELPLKEKAFEIAKKSVESIEGIKGFVGVDLIINDDVYFLEINSRFTTPYVGIKKIANFNVGKSIIKIIDKKIAIDSVKKNIKFNRKVKFIKNGNDLDINFI